MWLAASHIVVVVLATLLGLLVLAVDREMLPPSHHQHDLRIPILWVGPNTPDGATDRVVLLLLGEG
jgi:hypothetical protein